MLNHNKRPLTALNKDKTTEAETEEQKSYIYKLQIFNTEIKRGKKNIAARNKHRNNVTFCHKNTYVPLPLLPTPKTLLIYLLHEERDFQCKLNLYLCATIVVFTSKLFST